MKNTKLYLFMLCLLVVLAADANAFTKASDFACDAISCNTDNTTGKWNCAYVQCVNLPDFVTIVNQTNLTVINQTNVTVVNLTTYNITDCSETALSSYMANITTSLVSYLENYSFNMDENLNYTKKFVDCDRDKKQSVLELDSCVSTREALQISCVNRTDAQFILSELNGNVTALKKDVAAAKRTGLIQSISGMIFVYALIWFLKLRKPEVKRHDVEPTTGDNYYDSTRIEKDSKFSKLEAAFTDLKQQIDSNKSVSVGLNSSVSKERAKADLAAAISHKKNVASMANQKVATVAKKRENVTSIAEVEEALEE